MKKNPHSRILRGETKEQHLSTVPKSCPFFLGKLHTHLCESWTYNITVYLPIAKEVH